VSTLLPGVSKAQLHTNAPQWNGTFGALVTSAADADRMPRFHRDARVDRATFAFKSCRAGACSSVAYLPCALSSPLGPTNR
jgi:hypothetical protein